MCYFNGQKVTRAEYIDLMKLSKAVANYDFLQTEFLDGFTFPKVAILKAQAEAEDFDLVQMEWGFLPPYMADREKAKEFRYKFTTLNAKAENLFVSEQGKPSMYASAAANRRCLMLSTHFFEWRHVFPIGRNGQPLKTAVKYPYCIRLKLPPYFYMAAIWNPWTDRNTGEHVETVANITAPANSLMTQVHNSKMRMPAILNEELAWEWMFGKLSQERVLEIARTQYPAELMVAYTIAKDFKISDERLSPCNYDELPDLVPA